MLPPKGVLGSLVFDGVCCVVMVLGWSHTRFSALSLSLCPVPGRHCESVIDVCPRKPCQNGGTCAVASNMPEGFICQCPPVSTHPLLPLPCWPSSRALCLCSHGLLQVIYPHPFVYVLSRETQGFQLPQESDAAFCYPKHVWSSSITAGFFVLNLPLNYISLIQLTFFFAVLCFLCLLQASWFLWLF